MESTNNCNAKREESQASNFVQSEQSQYDRDGVEPEEIAEIDRTDQPNEGDKNELNKLPNEESEVDSSDQPKKPSPFGRKKAATKKASSKSVGRPTGRSPAAAYATSKMRELVRPYEKLNAGSDGRFMKLVTRDGYIRLLELDDRESPFLDWLRTEYYEATADVPTKNQVSEFVAQMRAETGTKGRDVSLATRIGAHEDALYLDLCNKNYEVVRIDKDGWEIVRDYPIYFKRTRTMLELPKPELGDVSDILELLSMEHDSHEAKIALSWLIQAFLPNGPYHHLIFTGESGAAKSTSTRIMKQLIDPTLADYTHQSNSADNIAINALSNRIMANDNISKISPILSDIFCELSTGLGISKRSHYTNTGETIINVRRPLILTSVSVPVNREDLISRCLFIKLKFIPEENRMSEEDVARKFAAKHPHALGAILSAISCALRNKATTIMPRLPRMADAAIMIEAASSALRYESGELLDACKLNNGLVMGDVLENCPTSYLILKMLRGKDGPELNAGIYIKRLFDKLQMMSIGETFGDKITLGETFGGALPNSPEALRHELDRLMNAFRTQNIYIEYLQRTADGQRVKIEQR